MFIRLNLEQQTQNESRLIIVIDELPELKFDLWIKTLLTLQRLSVGLYVLIAKSGIFQHHHHHHRDVGEGKAAHYRGGVPFSIPASRRSSSVCFDCHGLVSAASKWSHQSQSHRGGKSSIHQLKMMKSESSALIKASQGEITDTKRVMTTEKILMRNGYITRGRPSVSLRASVFADRPSEGVMELASEDAGGGRPPASPHTCRQMLWRPDPELANSHPHVPAQSRARRSRRNAGPGTVRAADCWPGSKPDLHHPLSQARVQVPKETSCELGKDGPEHVRVWTAGGGR